MFETNNNDTGYLMLKPIMDYVFKNKPNPYVLFDMLVNFGNLIATKIGGHSKWKDATITLINNNPGGAYECHNLLNLE